MTKDDEREAELRDRIATLAVKWKSMPSRPSFEQGRLSPEEQRIFDKLPARNIARPYRFD